MQPHILEYVVLNTNGDSWRYMNLDFLKAFFIFSHQRLDEKFTWKYDLETLLTWKHPCSLVGIRSVGKIVELDGFKMKFHYSIDNKFPTSLILSKEIWMFPTSARAFQLLFKSYFSIIGISAILPTERIPYYIYNSLWTSKFADYQLNSRVSKFIMIFRNLSCFRILFPKWIIHVSKLIFIDYGYSINE